MSINSNSIGLSKKDSNTSRYSQRSSNAKYLKNNKINFDKYALFDHIKLSGWWKYGVMKEEETDYHHLKNPNTGQKIIENGPIYNSLLYQADIFCLIPVNLDYVRDNGILSLESIDILRFLRKKVNDDNLTSSILLQKFPYLSRETFIDKNRRDSFYDRYILRYNINFRISKTFNERSLINLESIENESVSSKSVSSQSFDNSKLQNKCLENYKNINHKYKKFKNKISKTCNNYQNQTMLTNKEIDKMLKTFQRDTSGTYSIINVTNFPSILSLFYMCIKDKRFGGKMIDKKILVDNYELDVVDEDQIFKKSVVQDYGGVRDQMMTNVSKELFDMKIFERPDDSAKYFFNPEFSLTPEHILYLKQMNEFFTQNQNEKAEIDNFISVDNTKIYEKFYKFIGEILSFFIIKKYKLPNHLSSYILSNLKNKPCKIKDYEHMYFITNDFPEITKIYFNLMKSNTITDMNYNTQYKIQYDKDDGDDITEENIDQYLIDLAKHLNIHNTAKVYQDKDLNADMEIYHKRFSEGIDKILRRLFQYKNASLDLMDKIITQEEISNEILTQFSDNIYDNFTIDDMTYNEYIKTYNTYINNIFFKSTRFKSEDEKKLFIKSLLQFWTGIDFFKPELKYNLHILTRSKREGLRSRRLPVSHTCFQQIEIDIYETEDDFFKKLNQAIGHTNGTFSLAGGKRKMKN